MRAVADEQFLDGRDPGLFARLGRGDDKERERLERIFRDLPPAADDFVRIPLPRLASGDAAATGGAIRQYQREASVVDARLFRSVSLEAKGVSLQELCARLKTQTGVDLRAGRSVADEKVTLFVKDERARDVMRAVARLFGLLWGRTGSEGAYRYELIQDLKSQLAEEELRNQDLNAALVELDAAMEPLRPFVGLSFEEVRKRWEQTGDRRLFPMVFGGWGGVQLYHRLGAAERAALVAGQDLIYRTDSVDPQRRIPAEWQQPLLLSWHGGEPESEPEEKTVSQIRLKLNRSELGEVSLGFWMSATVMKDGRHAGLRLTYRPLASVRSPSVAKPENAVLNAALRNRSPYDRIVSLRPESSCPLLKEAPKQAAPAQPRQPGEPEEPEHVLSSDVWEAIHRATGRSVVADFYTRLHPVDRVTADRKPLFEALCAAGDAMGARWTEDGKFLLGRSTSYFWDKLKEVPNDLLERWRKVKQANGGLPLSAFLEIAHLSEEQLNSTVVAKGIQHCWGLPEWRHLGGGPEEHRLLRHHARFLASLSADRQEKALRPEGIPLRDLTPAQQQGALRLHLVMMQAFERQGSAAMVMPADAWADAFFSAEYAPGGVYLWTPPPSSPERPLPRALGPVIGRTAEEALAAARRAYPAASPDQVSFSRDGRFTAAIGFRFRYTPTP